MVGRFIYVFSREERDTLLANGYAMLKNDENKNTYIFANKGDADFDLSDKTRYALSDTLML